MPFVRLAPPFHSPVQRRGDQACHAITRACGEPEGQHDHADHDVQTVQAGHAEVDPEEDVHVADLRRIELARVRLVPEQADGAPVGLGRKTFRDAPRSTSCAPRPASRGGVRGAWRLATHDRLGFAG